MAPSRGPSDSLGMLNGRMLYQAFADTFSGGGWTDAPAWEDYDAAGQERYERAAERLRELLGGAP